MGAEIWLTVYGVLAEIAVHRFERALQAKIIFLACFPSVSYNIQDVSPSYKQDFLFLLENKGA